MRQAASLNWRADPVRGWVSKTTRCLTASTRQFTGSARQFIVGQHSAERTASVRPSILRSFTCSSRLQKWSDSARMLPRNQSDATPPIKHKIPGSDVVLNESIFGQPSPRLHPCRPEFSSTPALNAKSNSRSKKYRPGFCNFVISVGSNNSPQIPFKVPTPPPFPLLQISPLMLPPRRPKPIIPMTGKRPTRDHLGRDGSR